MAEEKQYSSKKTEGLQRKMQELSFRDNQAMRLLSEHVSLVKQDIGKRAASRKQSSAGRTIGLQSLGSSIDIPEGYNKGGRG
jgi:hypothetical protein